MSSSAVALSQVRAGHVLDQVVVRLLRFWDVRRGGDVMGMDLLFVDEQSTIAHASLGVTLIPTFRPLLRDGSVYVLSSFDVGCMRSRYRLSDFHLSLRFNYSTSLVAVAVPVPQIPDQVFRFLSHEEMKTLAVVNTDLPDVIGQVCSIKTFHDGITNNLIRVLLILQLQSGHAVRLTASDGQAVLLEKLLQNNNSESCVLLATNINPRMFAGSLHVGATLGTRFFFNDDLGVTRDFMKSVKATAYLARCNSVQVEHVTLAVLNYFVLVAVPQDIEYICTARIIGIQTGRGWCFVACSSCGRRMQGKEPFLFCNTCNHPAIGGDVKYRVEVAVEDDSSRAVFTIFDDEMENIVNIEASRLASQMDGGVHLGSGDGPVPAVIKDVIGSTFTFHLRLTYFNFSSYHESFTVSGMLRAPTEMAKSVFLCEDHSLSSGSMLDGPGRVAALGASQDLDLGPEKKKKKTV